MVDNETFCSDRQGRQFVDVIKKRKALTETLFSFVNDRKARERMVIVSIHLGLPALVGIVRALEQNPKINGFFSNTNRQDTLRFRQFVGVVIRMAMGEMGFKPTGSKGYLESFSSWFTRAEIFSPPPEHPEREIWESEQRKERGAKGGTA